MTSSWHRYARRAAPAAIAVVIAVSLATPALLWAHARLTKSDPAAKATLAVPPKIIRLWFSEAPEIAMTRIALSDSLGKSIPLADVKRGDDKLIVQASVPTVLPAGRYTVSWRVAAADGHPSSGSFTFSVRGPEQPIRDTTRSRASETTSASSPRSKRDSSSSAIAGYRPNADDADASSLAHVATRAVEFGALLIVIGGLSFVVLILPRAAAMDDATRDVARIRAARVIAVGGAAVLASAAARLVLQSRMMTDVIQSGADVGTIVTDTAWGRTWLAQVIAAVAVVAAMLVVRRARKAWIVAVIGALALAATPALSGHAGAAPRWTALAVSADTLHVIGAAGWLGSLLFVLMVGMPAVETAHTETRWSTVASLINTFSPVALTFAALVVLTGIVSATLRLGGVPALWSSSYGRVLLVKLAFLSVVLGTGAFNWLRVRPALGTEVATRRLRRSAATELAIGVMAVITTAVLVATATPVDPS